MSMQSKVNENLLTAGLRTTRYGLALNILWIGRLKFEDYEVENIRPLVTSSPIFSPLVDKFGERKIARAIGAAEIAIGSLIAAKQISPRASAVGSLAAVGMFATTLSFLATTPEAWQERRREPRLSLAGQFLLKDIVFLGASLVTAAESLQAARACRLDQRSDQTRMPARWSPAR
ncbi:YkgB family protein [Streptomyces sp. NBC_01602]|uniref:YkgB family protein n=1 Tax=Streptomyces sp. NBC_01602 TaxID=2975893 RepID=UPI00386BD49A|nr:YkgB family protein [Streptomyces sp. NBC_01602]